MNIGVSEIAGNRIGSGRYAPLPSPVSLIVTHSNIHKPEVLLDVILAPLIALLKLPSQNNVPNRLVGREPLTPTVQVQL
eukprot:scaffold27913_cov44-Attheya_sp.AAC.1